MALKPVRADDSISCVSILDPAFDQDASDLEAYAENSIKNPGCWRDHLKVKDGMTPTIFIIGSVPSSELARISDECIGKQVRNDECRWRCFLHGVRDIQNWPDKVPKKTVAGVEYVDPEWLSNTFVRGLRRSALIVGLMVWWYNQIDDNEIKN